MWAAKNGDKAVAKLLVKRRSNVNIKDGNGQTALHLAAEEGNKGLEVVRLLVELGDANIDETDNSGKTALLMAVGHHHTKMVQLLVWLGANVGKRDNNSRTALDVAAMSNFPEAAIKSGHICGQKWTDGARRQQPEAASGAAWRAGVSIEESVYKASSRFIMLTACTSFA